MAYKKPQDPLTNNGFGIYPLTTADQVILSDGSRLEKNGLITSSDSDKLGGIAASSYALKTDTAPDSSKLEGKTLAEIMLTLYPVGAVYISANSTSPASLFGGTWERIAQGRMLLGMGAIEENHNSYWGTVTPAEVNPVYAGEMGGEAWHTLTVSEMPSHGHYALKEAPGWGESMTLSPWTPYFTSGTITDAGSSGYTAEFWAYNPLKYTGDGLAHSNMPPYLAVYMWKRVS